MPKRKNPDLFDKSGMSWAGPRNRWCTGVLKIRVLNSYLRELRKEFELVEYIGIAADEPRRIKDGCYPLVEWGMTEKECLKFCYDRGFTWGGLYEIFNRVSCWCCPLQSLEELRKLYIYFPDLWKQLEDWDRRTWRQFRADYSVRDLTVRFCLEKRRRESGQSVNDRSFYRELYKELGREA